MDAMSIKFMIVIALFVLGGFPLFYKIGFAHGNRYTTLLLSSLKENSRYEVLAFSVHEGGNGDQVMFLKNMNANATYPLAAISGRDLAHKWFIGEIVATDEKKELSALPF
jgi:hypothetical protein